MSLYRIALSLILVSLVLVIAGFLAALGLGLLAILGLHDGSVPASLGYPLIAGAVVFLLGGLLVVIDALILVWRTRR